MNWKNYYYLIIIFISSFLMTGCWKEETNYPVLNEIPSQMVEFNPDLEYPFSPQSTLIPKVITDQKVLSLTFQGLGNKESLIKLLNELDYYGIIGTFFVSGLTVSEDPTLSQLVVDRGHLLGNATLTGTDLTTVDYSTKIKEIQRSEEQIVKYTNISPKFLRVGHGAINDDVLLAATQSGYQHIISFSINPSDELNKTPEEIAHYIDQKKQRGGIILLNPDKNPQLYQSIKSIYTILNEKSFKLIPLEELTQIHDQRIQTQFHLNPNWYVQELTKETPSIKMIEKGPSTTKKLALTFDDWATDDTIDSILDTLDKYQVKATFFVRANGVESNPSLAYAISKRGHEVLNHTYSHTDLNILSEEEIKEEVIKAHEIIAYAINKEPKRYLRPPRGIINDEIAQIIGQCQYSNIVMYGISVLDWKPEVSADEITNNIINNSYNGAIILLHILDNISTPDALPSTLEQLLAQGYEFVFIDEFISTNE